jgi:hypothetical protein
VGVRQRLTPRYDAHVGAVIPVRVRGKRVVIDWDHHLGRRRNGDEPLVGTWRMDGRPAAARPPPAADDDHDHDHRIGHEPVPCPNQPYILALFATIRAAPGHREIDFLASDRSGSKRQERQVALSRAGTGRPNVPSALG